jgi:tetratricopeptide (TPR) repeat protein
MTQGHFLAAIPLFVRAIALDANFAMAYYGMAMALDVAGDRRRSVEYIRKAFALIDRVSEMSVTTLRRATTSRLASWTKPLTLIDWAARTIPECAFS